MKYEAFTDGGARGNPGPAAIGAVLYKDGEEIATLSRYIGETTNNVAEYTALLTLLEYLVTNPKTRESMTSLIVHLDSELVVKQLAGEYKIKNAGLKVLYDKVQHLAQELALTILYVHVPRSRNQRADQLVNLALDAH